MTGQVARRLRRDASTRDAFYMGAQRVARCEPGII